MDTTNLDTWLNDREKLLNADWNELTDLQKQYPYSNLVAMILAKKHYLETGFLDSAHFRKVLAIQDQPGLSYAQMDSWLPERSPTHPKRKKPEEEKGKSVRIQTVKDTTMENYSDFTQWILRKNLELTGTKEVEISPSSDEEVPLREEIVSESLARIYEKQGLTGKAIEMYEKLSLKIPKKSSYFAEIIENLKKS
jgi:hypothetical protein